MKTYIQIFSILMGILMSLTASSQVPDSVYHKRLYHVCKAWGHAKYYHTEIANGSVDWDEELLNVVKGIKNAPNNDSFNDSLLVMLNRAGTMGMTTAVLEEFPDSLNNITDYSWINNPIFSSTVSARLDTIRNRFRPQSNVYIDEDGLGGPPVFDKDNRYFSERDYPSESKRVLALFRYWNIINYFFPYKDIMDRDWDSILSEFIPPVIEAPDAVSYHLAFKELTARINDSHSIFYSPTYWFWLGSNFPPFLVKYVDNEMVITKVTSQVTNIKVGDVITEIDDENIYDLRSRLRNYASGSNEVIVDRELNNMILRGNWGGFPVTLYDGNTTRTEVSLRNTSNLGKLYDGAGETWRDTIVDGGCNFGIVDMGKLESTQVSNMFEDLWDTDAIVFDVRNYPNGTIFDIVDFLYPSSVQFANFTIPSIIYPGRLSWVSTLIGNGSADPYSGEVIILFDERTQSHAEYTCMGLEQFPNSIKIGSTTSGADGNVAKIYLPGKIEVYATFLGTYYPDYTPTQRIGIIPDFEILPTIIGIREGKDEVMEFALNCDLVDLAENTVADVIKLFPNPAREEIRYDLSERSPSLIELFDLKGVKIKSIKNSLPYGVLKIPELSKGMYFLKFYFNDNVETKLFVKD